jgi:hypothetical protein
VSELLLPHPNGVPVHEDHEQLAARQVALVVLAEHGVAVPEQPPLLGQLHPSSRQAVTSVLLEQAGRVPLHASVTLFQVQPASCAHAEAPVLRLHGVGVPVQVDCVGGVHVQPGRAAHEADDPAFTHGVTVPEQLALLDHLQPVSVAQALDVELELQAIAFPWHRPPVGAWQPSINEQSPSERAEQTT